MDSYIERIEDKYHRIARLPESLLSFTIPVRKAAIGYLSLSPGSSVIDVGCGTGASFRFLEEVIGDKGRLIGIEPSRSMISVAQERVIREGWQNVMLSETTVEEFTSDGHYDGALLFAMHDVFNSIKGIEKIHSLLKDGGRIVCAGPRLQDKGVSRALNPILNMLFTRMAISKENKDKPWRLVESVFTTEKVAEVMCGMIFIYVGRKC